MAAVIADPAPAGGAVPFKRGKKKLLILVAAVLAVVLAAGGGGVWFLKKRAAHAAAEAASEEGGSAETEHVAGKADARTPPTYLPLDPFVINLADKEADRYAQIGITLEVESPVFADQMKTYMPAVRNAILMVITRKTSRELLEPTGKEQLAEEIMREAVRPMGIEIAAPAPVTPAPASASASATEAGASGAEKTALHVDAASAPKKPKHRDNVRNPIQHVNFSSFIIQ
jgi:flagellar protein FliL